MSSEYFDIVCPTYIENWPSRLCSLSIAQVGIPLTTDNVWILGRSIVELCAMFEEREDCPKIKRSPSVLIKQMDEAVARFPDGCFVRLGSRSPKDSWFAHKNKRGLCIITGKEAWKMLTDGSERVADDLLLAIRNNYAPWIFLRQWYRIPRWTEFRCFMEKRQLVGISQYQYLENEVFGDLTAHAESIEWAIKQFFSTFSTACHLDSVVFDVFVKCREMKKNQWMWEVKLLEINPFFEMTDPCLFDWRKPFDGSFRFVTKRKEE